MAQLPKAYTLWSEDHGFESCIVSNSKMSLEFVNPLEKQTFTNATVHPAVMASWEEIVILQLTCMQWRKLNL